MVRKGTNGRCQWLNSWPFLTLPHAHLLTIHQSHYIFTAARSVMVRATMLNLDKQRFDGGTVEVVLALLVHRTSMD